jgi:hypothetical protein
MKTMTASQLQKIREALSKALSGEVVELKIIQLSDSGIHIEVILREHPEEENKWFRFAEEMHEESPLRGKSDEIERRSREFRDAFSFDRGE